MWSRNSEAYLEDRSEASRGRLAVQGEAVGLGNISNTTQDGVLSTSASEDQLLVADGRVVDRGRRLDILCRALTRLVVGRETPRVSNALRIDGEVVVDTSSNENAVCDV